MVKQKNNKNNSSGILSFLRTNINDGYVMSILYYELRRILAENSFSFSGVQSIILNKRFLPKDVFINLSTKHNTIELSLSMLLSVRAIMLNKIWLNSCKDDFLLLDPHASYTFAWVVAFSDLLYKGFGDKDFNQIFCMLRKAHRKVPFSDEDIASFKANTIKPEERNLANYFISVAKNGKFTNEVIPDRAFVLDDMEEYTVKSSVAYIGNTAFAYCPNLKMLRIKSNNATFGKFPIVSCSKLNKILVPSGYEGYYKSKLPHYSSIIFAEDKDKGLEQEAVKDSRKSSLLVKEAEKEVKEKFGGVKDVCTSEANHGVGTKGKMSIVSGQTNNSMSTTHKISEKDGEFPTGAVISGTVKAKKGDIYVVELLDGRKVEIPVDIWNTKISLVGKIMKLKKTGFNTQNMKTRWKLINITLK